jgi:hypothetical protein
MRLDLKDKFYAFMNKETLAGKPNGIVVSLVAIVVCWA